jgi:hypothetical protein
MDFIEVVPYSEKCIVVRGSRTKEFVHRLKEEGGVYNGSLTDPITKMKFAGWLFKTSHTDKITSLVNEFNNYKSSNECFQIQKPMDYTYSQIHKTQDVLTSTFEPVDKLKVQSIQFDSIQPEVGIKVQITYTTKKVSGVVYEVKEYKGVVTHAWVRLDTNHDKLNILPSTLTIALVGLEWKVLGTVVDTQISFST